ncbi:hypothetical protein [Mucilaginibacter myungsuensis]|uniref:Uncharacterized protein n=1 Tax=Mucilaginibacter myungsuensis TaxID=649104 RepID=A0A929KZ90_9SPHI|nr:hypothetical protein [Mucilaginibacter myungsuensis]MBE9664436.1 hypothetical protein [Mucilaginibacter myungsuensis]MDN3601419.1 hypothetical protein [Mucilaginibacter myungsuensis]
MKGFKFFMLVLMVSMMSFGSISTANAQCAQCSAVVESNNKSGAHATKGLNKGILFLLAMPYLVVATGGYIWYKNYRKKNVELLISTKPFNLN